MSRQVTRKRLAMLGPDTGWHADQLRDAASRAGHDLTIQPYEAIVAQVPGQIGTGGSCEPGNALDAGGDSLQGCDAVLARTMPAGSFELTTFRLAALHALQDGACGHVVPVINPPRALEWCIDKYATIARLSAAGYPVPATRFVQTRADAMEAFVELGGDCVVKPLFGGEGRGVMRIQDRQLAWYTFSTLEQLQSVLQIQRFVAPGGRDTRMLLIGDQVFGIRRENTGCFRSNSSAGANSYPIELSAEMLQAAADIRDRFQLTVASIDLIDNDHGPPLYLEINAIPGWKAAQQVVQESLADCIIQSMIEVCR